MSYYSSDFRRFGSWLTFQKVKGQLEHGYTQEEGIDYDEVFAPVARIEAIKDFLSIYFIQTLQSLPNGCKKCISIW